MNVITLSWLTMHNQDATFTLLPLSQHVVMFIQFNKVSQLCITTLRYVTPQNNA